VETGAKTCKNNGSGKKYRRSGKENIEDGKEISKVVNA
jgi:hypothetical protein